MLTSIKGSNSVKILRKMTGNNPKLDLVNVDVHAKFGQAAPLSERLRAFFSSSLDHLTAVSGVQKK